VTFKHNSDLYVSPNLKEGMDYARRHRRHARFDDTLDRTDDVPKTTILAPHGGGIEPGTSELCLAIAGYNPANMTPAGVTYDYWMFEGLLEDGNDALHVTSTGCDDGVAVSLCAGALNALALHGFRPKPPDSEDDQIVLVGGGNAALQGYLLLGLRDADFVVKPASAAGGGHDLDGNNPCNIVNCTLLGMGGAQLELSTKLREAMFTDNTSSGRKDTTTQKFWDFVNVCRDALAQLGADQIAHKPLFRCEQS
jgi:phage replication-related protein YjqB (UPF0714/DUF867 family)